MCVCVEVEKAKELPAMLSDGTSSTYVSVTLSPVTGLSDHSPTPHYTAVQYNTVNPSYKHRCCLSVPLHHTHTHTHPFNGPSSGTTRVSRYQKGKTNLDFTEARDSERQWHQLGRMQVCTSLQTNNHASTPPLRFLQAGCPSCRSTNSVKALKGFQFTTTTTLLLRPR